METRLTPVMRRVYDRVQAGITVSQGDGTQYRTVRALADRGLIKLETEYPYWGVDRCRHLWSLRRWRVSKIEN